MLPMQSNQKTMSSIELIDIVNSCRDSARFHVSTGTKNDHAYTTTKFTPKGVVWIQKLWGAA